MNIRKVYIHCSASDVGEHDDISVIDRWHRERGFLMVGYHLFMKRDGSVQTGRVFNTKGAHVKFHNDRSIGFCLSGNIPNEKQRKELVKWCLNLAHAYRLNASDFIGHYEIDPNKTCPNMDMKNFREMLNKEGLK